MGTATPSAAESAAFEAHAHPEEAYRLVEITPDGRAFEELFPAPDDAEALMRARAVASGRFELWSGDRLLAAAPAMH